jgi:hypothetical protein
LRDQVQAPNGGQRIGRQRDIDPVAGKARLELLYSQLLRSAREGRLEPTPRLIEHAAGAGALATGSRATCLSRFGSCALRPRYSIRA